MDGHVNYVHDNGQQLEVNFLKMLDPLKPLDAIPNLSLDITLNAINMNDRTDQLIIDKKLQKQCGSIWKSKCQDIGI